MNNRREHFITKADLIHKHDVTDKEAISLMFYKNSHYEVINHYLRTGIFVHTPEIPNEKELVKHINTIEDTMYHLKGPLEVFRGVPSDLKSEFPDLSFMSTTTDINKTINFVKGLPCCIFKITISPEFKVFNFNDSEKEVLLEPRLKLINLSYSGQYQGVNVFSCELARLTTSETKRILIENNAKEKKKNNSKKRINEYKDSVKQKMMNDLDAELAALGFS
jgi:hypothetical protein